MEDAPAAGCGGGAGLRCDRGSTPWDGRLMATTSRSPIRALASRACVLALRATALGALALGTWPMAAQEPNAPTGTLSGTVLDQASGRPVADVIVLVQG